MAELVPQVAAVGAQRCQKMGAGRRPQRRLHRRRAARIANFANSRLLLISCTYQRKTNIQIQSFWSHFSVILVSFLVGGIERGQGRYYRAIAASEIKTTLERRQMK